MRSRISDNLNVWTKFIVLTQLRQKTYTLLIWSNNKPPHFQLFFVGRNFHQKNFDDAKSHIGAYGPLEHFVNLQFYVLKARTENDASLALQWHCCSEVTHDTLAIRKFHPNTFWVLREKLSWGSFVWVRELGIFSSSVKILINWSFSSSHLVPQQTWVFCNFSEDAPTSI